MKGLCAYAFSSIGQKTLMAVSGLGWALFALSHMAGNLLIFAGPQAYNNYGHAIVSNPAIYVAEIGLIVLFLTHVIYALKTTIENSRARKSKYVVSKSGEKQASLASRTMKHQGLVILIFLFLHISAFKFGAYYAVDYGQGEIRDLFRLLFEKFQDPVYVWFYVVCVLLLGFHLSHGLYSGFQSIGFFHTKYTPILKCASVLYGLAIAVGFASQPIYLHFIYQG
ncbi:MAG: succinate dehydrogenase cytochrome b subunit [Bdellovibrionales bacterium]|nr:succinate dehydrogenase cytochrome b subunit [Bdellovibrionales bacterium]